MRTKHEEFSGTSAASGRLSKDIPSTGSLILPQARRSEIRCLQDLGDLRQLFTSFPGPLINIGNDFDGEIANSLDEALGAVVQDALIWARQHEADGRHRDAEYLFRRASSNENIPMESADPYQTEDVLPTLVSIYERMGDYPAAEMAQETLLRRLFAKNPKHIGDTEIREVTKYSRLLSQFQKRIIHLNTNSITVSSTYLKFFVMYRAAMFDVAPLNEMLFEQGMIPLVDNHFPYDYTSLHIAVKENALNLVQLLISKGAQLASIGLGSETPLHIASEYGKPSVVELLLHNGADVEDVDSSGRTPLHKVLYSRQAKQELMLPILSVFIDAEADMEARDAFGRTVLCAAIEKDLQEVARYLIERGAGVEAFDKCGDTLLLNAVRTPRAWATRLLLEKGAKLEGTDALGAIALDVAMNCLKWGQEPIIQILLDHGAMTTVDPQDNHGKTFLQRAVDAANIPITEMLLRSGADIHERDIYGNTSLHRAVKGNQEPDKHIVRLLLKHSASIEAVNHLGDTVLHVAVFCKRRSMISILAQHVEPEKLLTACQMTNHVGQTPLEVARSQAEYTSTSSAERSVLFFLENALELSQSFIRGKASKG